MNASATTGKQKHDLDEELRLLRVALRQTEEALGSGEGDLLKLSTGASRLVDSIGRALLVQQRLASGQGSEQTLRTEVERVLAEMDQESVSNAEEEA